MRSAEDTVPVGVQHGPFDRQIMPTGCDEPTESVLIKPVTSGNVTSKLGFELKPHTESHAM
jgi:hypothetical protein